jgi:hypothetical protein
MCEFATKRSAAGPVLDSASMPSGLVTRTAGKVADRVPGLRRVPVVQLLTVAELALVTRDHLMRLTPEERRRLVTLVRVGHGRRDRLTDAERLELEDIVGKLAPRQLVGEAVSKLSPVPLPRRLTHGPRRRPR